MRKFIFFCSFFTFSVTSKPNGRTINLAIETSLQFEPKDLHGGIDLVSNIKKFIDKLYQSLGHEITATSNYPRAQDDTNIYYPRAQDETNIYYPRAKDETNLDKTRAQDETTLDKTRAQAETNLDNTRAQDDTSILTNFIIYLGNNVLNATFSDVQNITKMFKKHLNEYKKNGHASIYSIFSEPKLKKSVKKAIKRFSNFDVSNISEKLRNFLKSNNSQLQNFARRLNSFYTADDALKVMNLTKKLDKYLRKKKDANKIIKKILDVVVFNKYDNMNMTIRNFLVTNMKKMADYVSGHGFLSEEDDSSGDQDVSGSEGDEVHKHHRHRKITKTNLTTKALFDNLVPKRFDFARFI